MPNFVSVAASIAELAHGEKSHAQSLTQSPSLFDVSWTEANRSKPKIVQLNKTGNEVILFICEMSVTVCNNWRRSMMYNQDVKYSTEASSVDTGMETNSYRF